MVTEAGGTGSAVRATACGGRTEEAVILEWPTGVDRQSRRQS